MPLLADLAYTFYQDALDTVSYCTQVSLVTKITFISQELIHFFTLCHTWPCDANQK